MSHVPRAQFPVALAVAKEPPVPASHSAVVTALLLPALLSQVPTAVQVSDADEALLSVWKNPSLHAVTTVMPDAVQVTDAALVTVSHAVQHAA